MSNNRPFKRARPSFQVSQKRPIDKSLINVTKTLVADVQAATVLTTATFPCTVTGLRWVGSIAADTVTGSVVYWAIILVKDGNSANTMSRSDASTLYEPEQNVLAFGNAVVRDSDAGTGQSVRSIEGTTKSMRKLMGGDQIQFICISSAGSQVTMSVQFFCKS